MITEKTINDYTVELTNAYFKKRDGDKQGKIMKGLTEGTWEQIKRNAEQTYNYNKGVKTDRR